MPNHSIEPNSADGSVARERVEDLDVALIDRSPFQTRVILDHERISALAISIENHDLSSLILVRPKQDGRYELICGEHRLIAHRELRRPTIRAIIRALSDAEAAKVLAADNLHRSDLCDFEIYRTVEMLLDHGFAKTDAEVAAIIGRPRSYVSRVKAFRDLPEKALAHVLTTPAAFGASMIFELKSSGFNKSHPDLVSEALERVANGSLNQAGVLSSIRAQTNKSDSSIALKDSTFRVANHTVRMTVYADTIRISCKGMDTLEIESGLQDALQSLLARGSS